MGVESHCTHLSPRKTWKLDLIFKSGTGLQDWYKVVACWQHLVSRLLRSSRKGCCSGCICQRSCFGVEAQYASCHQASPWVENYVKECSSPLAHKHSQFLPSSTHSLYHFFPTTQGLEDDHWQKLQLEKVLACSWVCSFDAVA